MDNNVYLFGEYTVYQDGEEVCKSKNLITKFGKRYLTQYLAGQSNTNLRDIAIGIGSTEASINDTQLGFEFYRSPVTMSSIDIQTSSSTGLSTYGVVYKTTVPVDVSGVIKELGLFPTVSLSSTDYASNSISTLKTIKVGRTQSETIQL